MSLIVKMRKQDAIYWALTQEADSSGNPVFASPVAIKVRWKETTGGGEPGTVIAYDAEAYVGQDMTFGDYLMLGILVSSTPADPRSALSWEVISFNKTPNLKATEFLRQAKMSPSHLKLQALQGVGVEAITYKRVTGTSISSGGVITPSVSSTAIAVAVRERPILQEASLQADAPFALDSDIWQIPKKLLSTEPKLNDYFLDAYQIRWNVLRVEYGDRRSWWKVRARRGS